MTPLKSQYSDVVIVHRVHIDTRTAELSGVFAVTYPGNTDVGSECHSRVEAEAKAREIARDKGVAIWYQDDPRKSLRILVDNYRIREC